MNKTYSQFTIVITCLASLMLAVGCSKEAKETQLEDRAKEFYAAGELEKAKIAYLSLLQKSPGNQTAIRQLGMIWMDQGVPLRALRYLVRTRELNPNDVEARYQLAVVFRTYRQMSEARAEAKAVLQRDPSHGEALLLLAETASNPEELDEVRALIDDFPNQQAADRFLAEVPIRVRRKDILGANELVQRAVQADPKLPRALYMLGTTRLGRNDLTGAEQAFKEAAEASSPRSPERLYWAGFLIARGRLDEGASYLRECGEKAPRYVPIWNMLAGMELRRDRPDEALEALEKVFVIDPDHFEARLMQADCFAKKQDFRKAIELLTKLESSHPGQPQVKFQLARAHLQNGAHDEAVAALQAAVGLKADYPEAIFMLAQINLRRGRAEEVVPAMRQLLEGKVFIPRAAVALADALQLLGRTSEAIETLNEVVQRVPQNIDYRVRLSLALLAAGKPDDARSVLEQALQLDPTHPGAVSRLVDLDLAAKEFAAAQGRVDELMAKAPDSPAAQVIQARIHVVQQKWPEAEGALRKAIEANPEVPGAQDLLIQVLRASGKSTDALAVAEAALARTPTDEDVLRQASALYSELGDYPKAAEMYEKLRAALLLPDPLTLNNLASLYSTQLNQKEKGYELARQARELRPSVPGAQMMSQKIEAASIADTLGWIHYQRGEYAQALALTQEAAAFLISHPEVQYHYGMAAAAMDQAEAAKPALKLASEAKLEFPGKEEAQLHWRLMGGAEGTPVASSEIKPLVEKAPADVALRLSFAGALEREGNLAEAAEAHAAALARNGALARSAKKLAEWYSGPLNDPAKAETNARIARQLMPNDAHVAAILGKLVLQAGDHPFSYDLLREATSGGVRDASTLFALARAAYSLGQVEAARSAATQAGNASPDPPLAEEVQTFLTMTAPASGQSPDLAAAEAALQKNPRFVPALMIRGTARRAANDFKAAQADFEAALAVYPGFHPAKRELALLLGEVPESRERAMELGTQLRSALPEDAEVAELLARLSTVKKDYSFALQLFAESARTRPLDARAQYYQAVCQRETGDTEAAKSGLEKALADGLKEPLATEAREALAALNKP